MKEVVVDQGRWGKIRVSGKDRTRFLQGMVTNDVASLAEGGFCRAAILNVKGRVLCVVDIVAQADAYVVLTEPVTSEKTLAILQRHAIIDDVAFEPLDVPVIRIWSSPESVWTAPPLFERRPVSPDDEVEVRRVEGGLPRYGVDVSEDHFVFEANLDRAISHTKGCYVGQEVVARTRDRGQANRRLVGLRLEGEGPATPGDRVSATEREDAGHVTSSVVSPTFGPIALAYLHRSVFDDGHAVQVGPTARAARVASLPFVHGSR